MTPSDGPAFEVRLPERDVGARTVLRTERACLAIHRFGWPSGAWVYPEDPTAVKAEGMPWRPELVGRRFSDTPEGMAEFYRVVMAWAPPAPYALYVHRGVLYQLAPLTWVTPHAKAWNERAVALAVAGDFRRAPIPPEDWRALVSGTAAVCQAFGWDPEERFGEAKLPRIAGHTELPGGTADPEKSCPGAGLDLPRLRAACRELLRRGEALPVLRL
ncbi:MAG: N-acetylmuramoyl-L-alanine amidase [Deltaproteobacteria bacterium]|nr:MAG: N-acetylmuramoyl-L-alanine amidase [Deltaproteobacteria bacterium]